MEAALARPPVGQVGTTFVSSEKNVLVEWRRGFVARLRVRADDRRFDDLPETSWKLGVFATYGGQDSGGPPWPKSKKWSESREHILKTGCARWDGTKWRGGPAWAWSHFRRPLVFLFSQSSDEGGGAHAKDGGFRIV